MIDNWPTKKYATVVIDPPWPIKVAGAPRNSGLLRQPPYRLMKLHDISILPINKILSDDAWLFVWTTQKFLPWTLNWIDDIGLKYAWTMVWHKKIGPQFFNCAMSNAEFVVVGRKGNPKLRGQNDFKMCFNASTRGHSVKPAEFYNTIARVTEPPRIDLFSRRLIPGFDVWGDEAPTEVLPNSQYPLFDD